MNINEVMKIIYYQKDLAECVTGRKPERVILGNKILQGIINDVVFIGKDDGCNEIFIDNLIVTIDYKDLELIKVVPELE